VARGQRGFTTVQYVVATSFSFVLFVLVANVLVDGYERAAFRDALDEGVRAAVPTGSPAICEGRVHTVTGSLAASAHIRVDELECTRQGDAVVAVARVTLRSWLPMLLPDWTVHLRASARVQP
jgi:hypothetical protein